jgi:hypothetical protein
MSFSNRVAPAGDFRKQRECPASDTLLAYAHRSLPSLRRQSVRLHLSKCDFCGAELQLLSKHPPAQEAPHVPARIPLSLLLLAERSLPKRHVPKKPLRQDAA